MTKQREQVEQHKEELETDIERLKAQIATLKVPHLNITNFTNLVSNALEHKVQTREDAQSCCLDSNQRVHA